MLRLSAGCIRATQAAELQQLSAHPYTAVCHLGEDGSQGNLCLTYRGLNQILISAIYFICGSYALCRVFLAFSNSRPRRRLHAETYMLNRLCHGGRGHLHITLNQKKLLLRRTGKERPFPHSERIRERPLPIKMMNGKENAVQFFVNERERSGAQFFRERIRPWLRAATVLS